MSQQSFLLVLILLYLWTLRCVIQVLQDSCLSVRRLACYPDGSNTFWENMFIKLYNRFLAFKNVLNVFLIFVRTFITCVERRARYQRERGCLRMWWAEYMRRCGNLPSLPPNPDNSIEQRLRHLERNSDTPLPLPTQTKHQVITRTR